MGAAMFYVEVIGPLDAVYVGPFDCYADADNHANGIVVRNPIFTTVVMDKQGMDKQIALYGDIPCQTPDAWL